MNIGKKTYVGNNQLNRMFRGNAIRKTNEQFRLADSFNAINNYWKYNIDQTKEIVATYNDLQTATKLLVYVSGNKKLYAKNNLGTYEEYGVYENVDSLEDITTYNGKLVILNTDLHEYKWTNGAWVDLGEGTVVYGLVGQQYITLSEKSTGTTFAVTGTKHDTEFIFKKTTTEATTFYLAHSYSTDDRYEYQIFTASKYGSQPYVMIFDLGYSYSRRLHPDISFNVGLEYDFIFANGNNTSLYSNMAIIRDGVVIASGKKSTYANSNTKIAIGYGSINLKKWCLYTSTKKYEFTPIQIDGAWTWYNEEIEVTPNTGTLTPTVYEVQLPEEYIIPEIAEEVVLNSYGSLLDYNILNGQRFSIYGKKYKAQNDTIIETV